MRNGSAHFYFVIVGEVSGAGEYVFLGTGEGAESGEVAIKHELRVEDTKLLRRLWDEGKASGAAKPLDLRETREQARRRPKNSWVAKRMQIRLLSVR
jgi:antitoxin ParD1/3/4